MRPTIMRLTCPRSKTSTFARSGLERGGVGRSALRVARAGRSVVMWARLPSARAY